MKTHTDKFLQKRKFFMVLPALVLPFLTVIFWALGGGHGTPVQAMTATSSGLNAALPDPHFEAKEIWDKLSLYEIADRDSAKYEEARESDPYFDLMAFKTQKDQEPQKKDAKQNKLIDSFPTKDRQTTEDPTEEKVTRKLEELYREINKGSAITANSTKTEPVAQPVSDPEFTADVDRLEQVMEMMSSQEEPDPEMQQIEGVLEKILDIQHPERVKEKLKAQTAQHNENVFSVEALNTKDDISMIAYVPKQPFQSSSDSAQIPTLFSSGTISNGFYGLEDETQMRPEIGNAIEAIIHDTQELVAGATVKMRLLNDVTINGKVISKDQFIYGICNINGERLTIQVSSIRSGNSLLPVSLSVYDLDGLEGIYIPGAITRDAAKQASDDALQNIQLMSLDPTIGQQAASAGIEAAKGLLSKKSKLIKVTVKAGYKILLMDKV